MNNSAWEKIRAQEAPEHAVVDWLPLPEEGILPQGPLQGIPFAVKNNLCVAGARMTCASRLLMDYVSPYSATAVETLCAAGGVPVCTANLDEFGMGSTGENSALGVPENPAAPHCCPGGSSSGPAALVAAGCVPLALASDTGGSARLPAAYCGVYGWKPTYGGYSRYGLTAYASSLEQVGLIAENPGLLRTAHRLLSAHRDSRDAMHRGLPTSNLCFTARNRKIALLEDGLPHAEPAVAQAVLRAGASLELAGARLVSHALPQADRISAAYYIIACAEASANLARFTGLVTGTPGEKKSSWEIQFAQNRMLLGPEVQKRIAVGAYVLREGYYDRYYLRAQAYRRRLTGWFRELFTECDLALLPVSPMAAPPRGTSTADPLAVYQADALTACANLAGLPALSLPWGRDEQDRPLAVQLIAPWGRDSWLLDAADALCAR